LVEKEWLAQASVCLTKKSIVKKNQKIWDHLHNFCIGHIFLLQYLLHNFGKVLTIFFLKFSLSFVAILAYSKCFNKKFLFQIFIHQVIHHTPPKSGFLSQSGN
jgi:hypothetical protein